LISDVITVQGPLQNLVLWHYFSCCR